MSDDPLARLRELLGKATPRPWRIEEQIFDGRMEGYQITNGQYGIDDCVGDDDSELMVAAVNALNGLLRVADAYVRDGIENIKDGGESEGFARHVMNQKLAELLKGEP